MNICIIIDRVEVIGVMKIHPVRFRKSHALTNTRATSPSLAPASLPDFMLNNDTNFRKERKTENDADEMKRDLPTNR